MRQDVFNFIDSLLVNRIYNSLEMRFLIKLQTHKR